MNNGEPDLEENSDTIYVNSSIVDYDTIYINNAMPYRYESALPVDTIHIDSLYSTNIRPYIVDNNLENPWQYDERYSNRRIIHYSNKECCDNYCCKNCYDKRICKIVTSVIFVILIILLVSLILIVVALNW